MIHSFAGKRPLNRRPNEIVIDANQRLDATLSHYTDKPVIAIVCNGARWAGDEPADLGELLEVLAEFELDPWNEIHNEGFSYIAKDDNGAEIYPPGFITFQGNFYKLSHGFYIVTNDETAAKELTDAIAANRCSPAYKKAKQERSEPTVFTYPWGRRIQS